jgi:hypothetical protein
VVEEREINSQQTKAKQHGVEGREREKDKKFYNKKYGYARRDKNFRYG